VVCPYVRVVQQEDEEQKEQQQQEQPPERQEMQQPRRHSRFATYYQRYISGVMSFFHDTQYTRLMTS
jgi:hypothetical protein